MNSVTETALKLNVIIVDDEHDACLNLQKTLLEHTNEVNILGIANNTVDAEKQINKYKPDAVFLDIEMPQEDAFSFLERIYPFSFHLVFVTAYNEYAVRAFKLNAVDYILKPISIDEVSAAVRKVRERVVYTQIWEEKGLYSKLQNNLQTHAKLDKIKLKDNAGFDIVDFKDILYIEAKGSYSSVCYLKDGRSEKSIITSNLLSEYEELLPAEMFCRIHRSYLVNCNHVKKIHGDEGAFAVMTNNVEIPVSRRRTTSLMAFFKNKNL